MERASGSGWSQVAAWSRVCGRSLFVAASPARYDIKERGGGGGDQTRPMDRVRVRRPVDLERGGGGAVVGHGHAGI
ncbi:hypothetical protein BDA96_01G559300 [Sorghum bicolor]|uniref:Uncharacterized protein n=2 Tax=Sorghum bicolor TaxID=4558 RepID=A0A921S6Y5_SORBI|nr:hypothetical protein BDA96_01G559300 [Sorghum bicolor]OQU93343.1 hypothetical protein SORBI_3001G523932 [Sorghum bicolor]